MAGFRSDVLDAAAHQREVRLSTYGRKSGKLHDVTIWIGTDAKHLYIRSGQGMSRHWPQNLVARGAGLLHLGNLHVKVKLLFFFSSRRRHTRLTCDWSSDVCSSD